MIVTTFREDAVGNVTDVVEIEDPDDQLQKTCKRYAFTAPVTLVASSRVSLKLSIAWSNIGSTIHIGGTTLEMDRG